MKTGIMIYVENDLPRANYTAETRALQKGIMNYFGKKYTEIHESLPFVIVSCEVTEDDMEKIKETLPSYIHIVGIIADESIENKIGENIIDLRTKE